MWGYDIYEIEFENGKRTAVYRVKPPYLIIGEKAYRYYSDESLNLPDEGLNSCSIVELRLGT